MKTILVTGCAGFIGSHLSDRLLTEGYKVVGVDNFNDYYDPKIKKNNLTFALRSDSFKLYRGDILDQGLLEHIFDKENPQLVIHLAARAGVRPSNKNPFLYCQVNIGGTISLLKLAIKHNVEKFLFSSSSSVYGETPKKPFVEEDLCENIVSVYGATKRSAEFFVETFHHNWGLPCLILRLFTVYGPRGRPDMAPALFTKAILTGGVTSQFGDGTSSRDYTYIDDVVDGFVKAIRSDFNFDIVNLGNNSPVTLTDFIKLIENLTHKKSKIKRLSRQVGDVEKTWANVVKAKKILGWEPKKTLAEGMRTYIKWLGNQH